MGRMGDMARRGACSSCFRQKAENAGVMAVIRHSAASILWREWLQGLLRRSFPLLVLLRQFSPPVEVGQLIAIAFEGRLFINYKIF